VLSAGVINTVYFRCLSVIEEFLCSTVQGKVGVIQVDTEFTAADALSLYQCDFC